MDRIIQNIQQNQIQQQSQPMQGGGADPRMQQQHPKQDKRRYPITEEEIKKAYQTYRDYDSGFKTFVERCKENERIYRQRFEFSSADKLKGSTDFSTRSAWLVNAINNKHADAMDNMPSPVVLPREESDKQVAQMLQYAIPTVLERNDYETTYSDTWYSKIKFGMRIEMLTWDGSALGGVGDISITAPNVLNCRWDPDVTDIQNSKNFFFAEYVDNDILIARFPWVRDKLPGTEGDDLDEFDRPEQRTVKTGRSLVINWYYKRTTETRVNVHYCKFVGDQILYASENLDEYAEKGYYWHGKYPFVLDRMFPEESSTFAFGLIDIGRDCQKYIDNLQGAILKNALLSAKRRKLVREDGQINMDEYRDYNNDIVTYRGAIDPNTIVDLTSTPLPDIYVSILNNKIDELKETTNCRDFSQGGTASGVTAASAIAALQEAGSKTSRDIIKASYRSYKETCYMIIELIRQFYDIPRMMRIVSPNGAEQFVQVSNRQMLGDTLEGREPVYDITITAQKSSPYSTMAQNELAKELYGAGLFNPQLADQAKIAIDMMDFEGKEAVLQKVSENSQLLQAVTQLQQTCAQLAAIVDQQNGTSILAQMQQEGLPGGGGGVAPEVESSGVRANSLGAAVETKKGSMADKVKSKAMDMAAPA